MMVGDRPFTSNGNKTTNKRVHDFIGPVPKHIPCPHPQSAMNKRKETDPDAPPAFRPSHNHKSRATPSVALNLRNLRRT